MFVAWHNEAYDVAYDGLMLSCSIGAETSSDEYHTIFRRPLPESTPVTGHHVEIYVTQDTLAFLILVHKVCYKVRDQTSLELDEGGRGVSVFDRSDLQHQETRKLQGH